MTESSPGCTDTEPKPSATTTTAASPPNRKKSGRESVESFVVVFVAFLMWSLEAEGFVIPDGLDGSDLDGSSQGSRLPSVRIHLYCERRWRGRADGPGRDDEPARRYRDMRELPLRIARSAICRAIPAIASM